ncbi:uncharacterized protein LOC112569221 [Pomacea canaliculata]|uniref:uncharacterized protein LOC112569221 n=1 Tax=Pomacea canaliculata TaxID=400727 RepID=UPI000D735166|nr:uncharacterized protein LOC112569221 [Pomacea canaliculata]XP_025102735.1 uncharacterized protein LOC112569221 [Pomacea canaliculata]XP_025102736.1 uncharacterized protein LOC112569221 [Pomacea canaliculata]
MSQVESDDTNTPNQTKRPRITPIRFRDAQLTDIEGEKNAEESLCDDHSMQQCPPPLPYSLPPVVVSPRVSPSSSYRQSTISLLPSHLQHSFSVFHPASIGTHNPLEAQLEKLGTAAAVSSGRDER